MIGAIIGDIAGSRFEWHNIKTKEFELFTESSRMTDDSVMTLAIAKALLDTSPDYSGLGPQSVKSMQRLGRYYEDAGYGRNFLRWIFSENPRPYNSYGNGAAMRVSPCGLFADSLDQARELARRVTEVTHNHPEGIRGAEATASAVYLARSGESIPSIRTYITEHFYPIGFTLDSIRDEYSFDVSCQGSVPQALEAFFESTDFEDAIRNAISIGGDSDTIGAIAGGVAGAFYGVPDKLREEALAFFDLDQVEILFAAEKALER